MNVRPFTRRSLAAILIGVAVGSAAAWCLAPQPDAIFTFEGRPLGWGNFHPDNRLFALTTILEHPDGWSRDWHLRFIDGHTGQEISQWQDVHLDSKCFTITGEFVAAHEGFTVDEPRYVVFGFDGWRGTQREIVRFPDRRFSPRISPGGRTVLAENQTDADIFLEMWNLSIGELKASVGNDRFEWRVSPDGRQLAINELTGVQIWNIDEGRHESTITGFPDRATQVGFDSTGMYLRIQVCPVDERNYPIYKESKVLTRSLQNEEYRTEVRPVPDGKFGGFHSQLDEVQGWRIYEQEPRTALVFDPAGQQVMSVNGLINRAEIGNEPGWGASRDSRFIRDTELIEFSLGRRLPSVPTWLSFFPWLSKYWPTGTRGEYRLVNRQTGAVVWHSNATKDIWDELRRYCVSPNGQRLAEMISNGNQTTIRFWSLPVRRWHRWVAGGLGVVIAALTWWCSGRIRRSAV